jgi:hypothetical protein
MKQIFIGIIVLIILALLFALPTMILWNAVMPDVIGVSRINFQQAICITLLSRCLFVGCGSGGSKKE